MTTEQVVYTMTSIACGTIFAIFAAFGVAESIRAKFDHMPIYVFTGVCAFCAGWLYWLAWYAINNP